MCMNHVPGVKGRDCGHPQGLWIWGAQTALQMVPKGPLLALPLCAVHTVRRGFHDTSRLMAGGSVLVLGHEEVATSILAIILALSLSLGEASCHMAGTLRQSGEKPTWRNAEASRQQPPR